MQESGPSPANRLRDSYLEVKKASCLPNTIKAYEWATKRFVDRYYSIPTTPEEVIGFVESARKKSSQRSLERKSKQLLYDVIRDFYAWIKGYYGAAAKQIPDLPGVSFLSPTRKQK